MRLVPRIALVVVVVHDPAVEGFVSGMAAWCVRMKDFYSGTQNGFSFSSHFSFRLVLSQKVKVWCAGCVLFTPTVGHTAVATFSGQNLQE